MSDYYVAEKEAVFNVVKSIISTQTNIKGNDIYSRDTQSYLTIIVYNNNRNLICRFYLKSVINKQIAFVDENKNEEKYKINSIDDIYAFSDRIVNIAKLYEAF
jgi:hypothetical protein